MAGGTLPPAGSGGGEGDADLTFHLLSQNAQALNQISQLTQALQRANAEQTKFASGSGAPRGIEWWAGGQRVQLPQGRKARESFYDDDLAGDFSTKKLRGKHFTFGAEGVRVGHIRLSRSGLGISEKTLADRGLEGAVLGGQIGGRIVQAVGKYMEMRRKGDDVGQAIYAASTGAVSGLARMAIEIFGFRHFAEGFNSILGASPPEDFNKLYQDFWEEGLGAIAKRREEVKELRYKNDLDNRVKYRKVLKDMWVSELQSPAAKSDYWVEQLRRELADEESEERAMTRSLTGRPLWKVLNYSPNEGIP